MCFGMTRRVPGERVYTPQNRDASDVCSARLNTCVEKHALHRTRTSRYPTTVPAVMQKINRNRPNTRFVSTCTPIHEQLLFHDHVVETSLCVCKDKHTITGHGACSSRHFSTRRSPDRESLSSVP